MSRKLAIKRLTVSDLTFFASQSFSLAPELLDFGEEIDLSAYTDAG